jgi:putative SOS response-associated peptidase YedK
MCGRYTQTLDLKKIVNQFGITQADLSRVQPSHNIAPSQPVAVIHREKENLRLDAMKWGLVPAWAKDPGIGNRMINARSETLTEKPSFRGPFKNSRCLIPADGFFEWKREGRLKQPYYIRLKSKEVFTFAGLWSYWMGSDGSELLSCAIITGTPNELIKPIHHRMPIILPEARREEWMDLTLHDVGQLLTMLQPYPSDDMEAYPISTFVNSPANNSSECTKRSHPESLPLS